MPPAITTLAFKFYSPSKRTFTSHKVKNRTPVKTIDVPVNTAHHDENGMSKGNELDTTAWPPLSSLSPPPVIPIWPVESSNVRRVENENVDTFTHLYFKANG